MKITAPLFEAFLKCPTKCHLRSLGETGSGNEYAEWVRTQNESYKREAVRQLQDAVPETERIVAPPADENRKTAKWRLAVDLLAQTPDRSADSHVRESLPNEETRGLGGPRSDQRLESLLHAVERVPSEGRGKAAQFVPIRFIYRNKLTPDDRLLLAFDALALSQVLGREIKLGKIIHGDDHATLNVKLGARTAESARTSVKSKGFAGEVRKRLDKIATLFSSPASSRSANSLVRESQSGGDESRGLSGPRSAPDLVLNRHCAECEFQARCRKIAIEKDDLSLLAGMSAKERQKLRSKGIFTVTQLSYTFRPRRRPKRQRDKREKYHHSLKALAIREQKIHIVGSPELKIEGTPVYLDVEGLPDRDFYYLIGLRIGHGEAAVQHSLWADTVADEGKIWREFLAILETVEKPVLIHYGSYETTFLDRMCERYGKPPEGSAAAKAIQTAVNLLSVTFARVYFSTFSNGLKEVAGNLGFRWSDPTATGIRTVVWRQDWEASTVSAAKQPLLTYNTEDCTALEVVAKKLLDLHHESQQSETPFNREVVDAAKMKWEGPYSFKRNTFAFPALKAINNAAYWDYQRERVFVKSNGRSKHAARRRTKCTRILSPNKTVDCDRARRCPKCGSRRVVKHDKHVKTVIDLKFTRHGIKRWITRYRFHRFLCKRCGAAFNPQERSWTQSKYGSEFIAYVLYLSIELRLPQIHVDRTLNRFFGFDWPAKGPTGGIKEMAAKTFNGTYDSLIKSLCSGRLLHADETKVSVGGEVGFVWIFANMEEVAYVYSETREGDLLQTMLKDFKGVLVSDFYAAYDAIDCPQQKCLIHLIRDLNDDLFKNPYDEELKRLSLAFSVLVKPMVETIDRYGLKRRFLRKHLSAVDKFYRQISDVPLRSEKAVKLKDRLEKNRDKLFTFLSFDGVPWNNNNAEHAVKPFATLRQIIGGVTSEKGLRDYLVLLSICQTCKYMGVDFLDFLRSGEKDIHAFAESRRGRKRRPQTSQPPALPADAIPGARTAESGSPE